jgi:hypothetical protein
MIFFAPRRFIDGRDSRLAPHLNLVFIGAALWHAGQVSGMAHLPAPRLRYPTSVRRVFSTNGRLHGLPRALANNRFKLLDCERRLPPMQHCMAVRTDRSQVLDGIKGISRPHLAQRLEVMHMDEALAEISIDCTKIEIASPTDRLPVRDTRTSSGGVALIDIYQD